MNKLYIFLLILCGAIAFASCSDEGENSGTDPNEKTGEIFLSSLTSSSIEMSRSSIGNFPNNGRIGVIAANYNSDPDLIDWTSYPDIHDTGATAVFGTGNSYTFTWDSQKYYPFDGKELAFMAYSPPINETQNNFILSTDGRGVYIKLYDGMPDFLYANGNATATAIPHSKSSTPVVDLGEFQHALSKLTVEVVGDVSMNPNVRLTNLSVKTGKSTASFYLPINTLFDPQDGEHIYNLVSESTQFSSTNIVSHSVFLFPGTEDVTEISIGLSDNTVFVSYDYMMSFFQNVTNAGQPLLLERGKNTTLRIVVKGTTVTSVQIELKGILSDWNEKGNFGVTIN